MIIRNNSNIKIEKIKKKLNLTGDVYVIGFYIESLSSHKKLFANSKVKTIEEAEEERRNILKIK